LGLAGITLTKQRAPGGAAEAQPAEVIPLFSGDTFDAAYNARRPTLRVRTPEGTARALLVAVITGAPLPACPQAGTSVSTTPVPGARPFATI